MVSDLRLYPCSENAIYAMKASHPILPEPFMGYLALFVPADPDASARSSVPIHTRSYSPLAELSPRIQSIHPPLPLILVNTVRRREPSRCLFLAVFVPSLGSYLGARDKPDNEDEEGEETDAEEVAHPELEVGLPDK